MLRLVVMVLRMFLCFMLLNCSRSTSNRIYKPYGPRMCEELCQDTPDFFLFMIEDLSCRQLNTNTSFTEESSITDVSTLPRKNRTSNVSHSLPIKDNCGTLLDGVKAEQLYQANVTGTLCIRNKLSAHTNYDTALRQACKNGNLCVVQYILNQRLADINCRDKERYTPVMTAARYGQESVFHFLVYRGCNLSTLTTSNDTLLHLAAKGGSLGIVQKILVSFSFNIESKGRYGWTPVFNAARYGHQRVFHFLTCIGCNLTAIANINVLAVACLGGNLDIVKYVISRNVTDMESRDTYGNTPVLYAVRKGHVQVVDLLVHKGCDMTQVNILQTNILHVACNEGHLDMVRYIITLNVVQIDSKQYTGDTPVMLAAEEGHKDVVQLLVQDGCNLAAVNKNGNNVLHVACYGGHTDVVEYLLTIKGVDVKKRNKSGQTPLNIATLNDHRAVITLLKEIM